MKRILIAFLLVGFPLIGCSNQEAHTNYTSPSRQEVDDFISEHNIDPLTIEETKDATILLLQNGIYYLSNNENDKLIEDYVGWSGNDEQKVNLGLSSTGMPHAHVIINDERLLDEAKEVEVKFHDGTTVTQPLQGKRGLILFYDKSKRNLTIHNELHLSIYNQDRTVIYEDSF
ncbi:hypothetical protein [Rossellomorea aquimaris]|uniref:Uncharacterized protein n=1 Tax=Rossellomorea aquimaris TaxID=189382 RepID=A0A366ENB1_9BACI|nr:hypothetical protein [Rossellomorea aquimaris]RBP02979.1 hypothetical protein DET59_11176 [Rossellomorea aquimaris]